MSNSFRIVHIITGLNTGGAEKSLYNLLNGGLFRHCDNHVISLIDEGTIGAQIKDIGIPVTTLDMRNGRPSLGGLRKLHKVVRAFQPDIIQGWMYHGNLMATLARRFSRGNPILTWNVRQSLYELSNEKFITQQVIRLNRLFSSSPSALLYNSQISQSQHETFGFSSKKRRVIPNGIDIQKFSFSALYRQKVRTQLGIPEKALVVGHVARLHPMKDHPLFLKAAVKIAQRNLNVHFLLSGRDVSMENEDIRRIAPQELRNRFHLLGERVDIPVLMCAMDILCLSSAWGEGFPNVIVEAMATSLPCVATDVGDSKIIVGNTGVIVPARSEKELVSGIDKLLTLPHQELQALGKKARTRIKERYTLKTIVEQYISLYEQLISVKRES